MMNRTFLSEGDSPDVSAATETGSVEPSAELGIETEPGVELTTELAVESGSRSPSAPGNPSAPSEMLEDALLSAPSTMSPSQKLLSSTPSPLHAAAAVSPSPVASLSVSPASGTLQTKPTDALAGAFPAWDLLPPHQFVKRISRKKSGEVPTL